MWLKFSGFMEVIKWCSSLNFDGFVAFVFGKKLKTYKGKIKTWNREVFGKVEVYKERCLGIIHKLDLKEQVSGVICGGEI